MEKYLKLLLRDRNRAVCTLLLLVLLPAKTDLVIKEKYRKTNLVSPPSFGSGIVVFILLTKVVAFHMRLSVIYVQRTNFQGFVLRLLKVRKS